MGLREWTGTAAFAGGLGAQMIGDISVTPGQTLKILVGQQGGNITSFKAGGGGGGSFVTDASNNPLVIAGAGSGGGGNTNPSTGNPGLITTSGGNSNVYSGGSAEAGGGGGTGSGGGGGLTGNGVSAYTSGGQSFINGGAGSPGGTGPVDRVLLAVVMEDLVGVLVVNGVIKALQVLEEDIQVEQELWALAFQLLSVLQLVVKTNQSSLLPVT